MYFQFLFLQSSIDYHFASYVHCEIGVSAQVLSQPCGWASCAAQWSQAERTGRRSSGSSRVKQLSLHSPSAEEVKTSSAISWTILAKYPADYMTQLSDSEQGLVKRSLHVLRACTQLEGDDDLNLAQLFSVLSQTKCPVQSCQLIAICILWENVQLQFCALEQEAKTVFMPYLFSFVSAYSTFVFFPP